MFVPNSLLAVPYPTPFSVGIGKISAVCGPQYIWETELELKLSVFVAAFSVFSRDLHHITNTISLSPVLLDLAVLPQKFSQKLLELNLLISPFAS